MHAPRHACPSTTHTPAKRSKVGGMHPTGMLFLFILLLQRQMEKRFPGIRTYEGINVYLIQMKEKVR